MSRRFGIQSAVVRVSSVTVLLAALAACSDRSMSITGSGLPPASSGALPTGLGIVEGSVDSAGNVTLTPLQDGQGAAGSYAPGIDGNVYAGQNVNVRVYADRATTVIRNGRKIWTMEYGVRNYLPFPIGSNQGGSNASDTTGIFLVFMAEPTVTQHTSGCGSCTMFIARYDGIGNFTSPSQKYLYWHQRLAAKQPAPAADTVRPRDTVTFSSPTQVTNFKFYMMVGADWPAPHQTNWHVFYNASTDSEPDIHAKPVWHRGSQTLGTGTERWAVADTLRTSFFTDYYLYRRDSLASNTPAYMQAVVAVNSGSNPSSVFGFLDGQRMAAVGIAGSQIGFVTYQSVGFFGLAAPVFVSGTLPINGTLAHTYTLHKYGIDSVTVDIEETHQHLAVAYAALPAANVAGFASSPAEFFGTGRGDGSERSAWNLVTYGIGVAHP